VFRIEDRGAAEEVKLEVGIRLRMSMSMILRFSKSLGLLGSRWREFGGVYFHCGQTAIVQFLFKF
jgi:hypothetical protein